LWETRVPIDHGDANPNALFAGFASSLAAIAASAIDASLCSCGNNGHLASSGSFALQNS